LLPAIGLLSLTPKSRVGLLTEKWRFSGRAFGGYATVSLANHLLCVENEIGKLAIYDLNTMEKRDEYVFSNPIPCCDSALTDCGCLY
jgi:hypothetical protein